MTKILTLDTTYSMVSLSTKNANQFVRLRHSELADECHKASTRK